MTRPSAKEIKAMVETAGVPVEAQNRPEVATYRELVEPPRQRMIEA